MRRDERAERRSREQFIPQPIVKSRAARLRREAEAVFASPANSAGSGRAQGRPQPRYCCCLPIFVGPWRAAARGWRSARPDTDAVGPSPTAIDDERRRWRASLRRERRLGRSGDPAYDLDRHARLAALLQGVPRP